jgi:hypothetical protein
MRSTDEEGTTTVNVRSLRQIPLDLAFRRDVTVLTMTGGFTPYYAPPEAFDGLFTRHFDQYSLALVFCEVVFGRIPFEGTLELQIAQRRQGQLKLAFLPEGIRPVIAKALAPDSAQRFSSCVEFLNALGACPIMQMTHYPQEYNSRYGVDEIMRNDG